MLGGAWRGRAAAGGRAALGGAVPPRGMLKHSFEDPKHDDYLHVVVVFTLNRSFYPTTSVVPPVSLLILHPRDTNSAVTVRQRKT